MELLEWNGYTINDKIGCGRFGSVYTVNKNGVTYAAKISTERNKKKWLPLVSLTRELEVLIMLKDKPGVSHLIDALPSFESPRVLIMEFVPGVTLDVYSPAMGGTLLPDDKFLTVAKQLIEIIHMLHSCNIAHRDIKLDNIIYDDTNVTLVDFGSATSKGSTELMGSILYISPDVLNAHDEHTFLSLDVLKQSDLYAVGITLYLLANDTPPYPITELNCGVNFRPDVSQYRKSDKFNNLIDLLISNFTNIKFEVLLNSINNGWQAIDSERG